MITRNNYGKILYSSSKAMHSTREGQKLARLVYEWMPDLSLDSLLYKARTMVINVTKHNRKAYQLSFILMYLKLACQNIPEEILLEESVNVLTHDERKENSMHFKNYIKLQAVGRLGRDPELNVTADGTPVTKCSLAVSMYRGRDDSGERKEDTQWWNLTAWRTVAEHMEKFCQKGDLVMIIGEPTIREYTDREGIRRHSTDLRVDDFVVMVSANSGNGSSATSATSADDSFLPDYPDDTK